MGSKYKHIVSAVGSIRILSSREATRLAMPRFNGFACGYGAHGNIKYNRAKEKSAWKKSLLE